MRIKTITANDMAEAIRLIRDTLGAEATILSTRKTKNSKGQPTLEITAAVDDPPAPSTSVPPLTDILKAAEKASVTRPTLVADIPHILKAHGLPDDVIIRITEASMGITASGFSDKDALDMLLGKLLVFKSPSDVIAKGKAHVILGPSGAGKTTLISKLAIHAKRNNLTVGLMSLDDQKIAGFEPLRIVAEAMGEAAHLIRSAADLTAAAKNMGPRHLILVDTPGLNPYNRPSLNAFKKRLADLNLPLVAHLALPAPMQANELAKLPVAFGMFNISSLLITKLDETAHIGGVIGAAHAHQLPLSLASHSPDPATAPLTLNPLYLAEILSVLPQQPWEMAS